MKQIEIKSVSDELAEAILQIDAALKQMQSSGLKTNAIIVLLKDMLGQRIRKSDIQDVLWGLDNLKDHYFNKE